MSMGNFSHFNTKAQDMNSLKGNPASAPPCADTSFKFQELETEGTYGDRSFSPFLVTTFRQDLKYL